MVAGIRGPIAIEDAVEIVGWMARANRIPPVDKWVVREDAGDAAMFLESLM